jgi:CheY-like chemotaxis protein
MAEIIKAGERAAALTRQLLAFSRQQVLEPHDLDVNAIVANMEAILRRMVGSDVTLKTILEAQAWTIRADAGQLEQVIANLAVNARDAMPGGGALTIETANVVLRDDFAVSHGGTAGPHVRLTVRDTGTGMSAEVQSQMFEPFFTTKEPGQGTGLGLSTVLGVVQQSNGCIIATSEPGHGTTFDLFFPRAESAALPIAVPERSGGASRGGETVLLVDDTRPLREFAARVLRSVGYRVLTAGTGEEAIALVAQEGVFPDLVISDVVMPGLGGDGLVQTLLRENPALKVLLISGHPEAVLKTSAANSGWQVLLKPFTETELIRTVREVIDREPSNRPHSAL